MTHNTPGDLESTDHKCPNCDRSFTTRSGLGTHHSNAHGEGIIEYERRQGEHKCPHCEYAFHSANSLDNHKRSQHPEELRERVECENCGDIIEAPQSHERRFCSEKCRGEWSSEYQSGNAWKERTRITKVCEICDSSFEVVPSESDTKFCSRECYAQHRSETYVGKNAPAWNGGSYTYSAGWTPEKKEKSEETR